MKNKMNKSINIYKFLLCNIKKILIIIINKFFWKKN